MTMEARSLTVIREDLAPDRGFYEEARRRTADARPVETIEIPPFSGRGFRVPKGSSFRVVLVEGPQVADVGLWSSDTPSEFFSATRTWVLEGWFIRPGSRLWSDIPRLRPMATCIADTVVSSDADYHHHFVGTHCSPEWLELRTGIPGLNACHVNLLEGIEPFGLSEADLRDNFMVHQKVRLDSETGRLSGARSDGKPGDYVEFFAEIDVLVAIGLCPNGDNTHYWSRPEDDVVKPLRVDIFETGLTPHEFPEWNDWRAGWAGSWLASQLPE
jgi:uncharacterized protein